MVERSIHLDSLFHALSDRTRRDILQRVSKDDVSIGALAEPYQMSFAAIAKHISVLEAAKLITKRREGKRQIVSANPETMVIAVTHLEQYQRIWRSRFDALDDLLK